MIRLEHVSKRFKTVTAVRDISFEVQKGEILGFLGPNAAGKTTTMRMITGYLPATQGRISVAGYDIFHHPREAKRRIGYLPENVPLYQELTVEGYLGHRARLMGIPRGDRAAAIKRVVNSCALEKVAQDHVRKLSKGFRQRLGLAQALLHDPEVLILDEPTAGLDPKQINETRHLIRSLSGERTVVLSTHILPEVSMTCSRVLIIDRGALVAEGPPERLTAEVQRGQRIVARVRGHEEQVLARVRSLGGVKSAVAKPEGEIYLLTVDVEQGKDLREALARALVEGGFGLLEIYPETLSLEDIFLNLTTSEEVAQ